MTRGRKVLERHFRHWRERGLVSAEQEALLRESSEELARGATATVLRTALAGLGGGLLLAGLVLIVAENWQVLHRSVKLGGWAVLQIAFLLGTSAFERRWPDRPPLAEALAFVAGGWVMAGIALVSQIYHLDSRPPNGIWLWLLLILPGAWVLRRRAVSALVFIALLSALSLEVVEKDSWVHAVEIDSPWLWLGLPLLAAAITSWVPRRAAFLRGWIGAWTFLAANVFLLVFGATQDFGHSALGRAWWIAAPGLLLAVALPRRVLPQAWDPMTVRLLLPIALLPWILVGARYETGNLVDTLAVGASWIAQILIAILIIRAGARADASVWVNLGYLALLAGILTRYFDFFGEYLEGGAALAATGVLLLFILYSLEKARRRTLAGDVRT